MFGSMSKLSQSKAQAIRELLKTEIPLPHRPFNQACVLQQIAFSLASKPTTKPAEVAQLMRAWEALEERKRILRMKPKPKDLDVSPKTKRTAAQPIVLSPPLSGASQETG